MAKETKAIIKDEVSEWNWWTRLPNIVLTKVEDPHEGWLLFAIRKVAGDNPEDGVCYMTMQNLADLAKMGRSTVRKKIHSLADKGLIRAEIRKAPKGRNVWHITVPRSLWEENEEAYRQLSEATDPLESMGTPDVPDRYTREYGTGTPDHAKTKNHTKKNPNKKKRVGLFEKDEFGKYIDRSPLKICPKCGQYQRQCYCEEEAPKAVEALR